MQSKRRIILTNLVLMGVFAALVTGIAIGTQSTLSSRIGSVIGNFKTGVLMNAIGGLLAMLIFITLLVIKGKGFWQTPGTTLVLLIIAGALGIVIVTGVSFSMQKAGVAVGMATLILGEMILSIIVDAKGWAGAPPIPITWTRIVGILVIAAGIYLLLPKKA
ncbi:DMT family transporter [bacterium]|nr:DMT family transporter [bacterium]